MSRASTVDIEYPMSRSPRPAQALAIRPGVLWLRLPLPFELKHINVWLLEDGDGWTLVDTGLDTPAVREAWEQLRRTTLGGRPVNRIIVTHLHPDHMGLARHLHEQFNAPVYMTVETRDRGRWLLQGPDAEEEAGIRAFCQRHGIERVEDYTAFVSGRGYRRMISGMPGDVVLIDGDSILRVGGRDWRPIIANGHAPGHMSLYCEEEGLLISGDQILPSITCNISVFASNHDEDALRAYLDSLDLFRELPADTLVLPSHGRVFTGLHNRIEYIDDHHRENLERLLSLCRQPQCLGVIAPRLYRRNLEGGDYTLAMGEAMAHLVYLHNRNELAGRMEEGVHYFLRE